MDRDANIKSRFSVFKNLVDGIQKAECKPVCQWLEQAGDYYSHEARHAKSYAGHADKADFSLRCYGAAGVIYRKFGFTQKELEFQARCYALGARLGLA
jgi:hypothetical protein